MTRPLMPQWTQPATQGMLSNSSTPVFKSRYSNTVASGDPAGQARFIATKTGIAANPSFSPNIAWDTGWLGAPTVTAMPVARYSHGSAQYGDRVYITGGIDAGGVVRGDVWSAPTGGGSVGTWRAEKPMSVRPSVASGGAILIGLHGHGCTAANFGTASLSTTNPNQKGQGGTPWLICYGGFQVISGSAGNVASSSMIAAPILADGVLGDWITISYAGWAGLGWTHLLAVPNQYVTTALVLSGGTGVSGTIATSSTWATIIRNAPASAQSGADWDAPQGWWKPLTTSLAPTTAGHTMAYDWANSTLLWFKGCNNSSGSPVGQQGFYYLGFGVDINSWNYANLGTSWGAGSAPDSNYQNNAGMVYFGAQWGGGSGGSPTSYVYILGGTNSNSNAGDGTGQNIVRYTTLTWNSSGVPTASAWSAGTALPSGATGIRAFIHEHGLNQGQLYGYPPWCDPNIVYFTTLGGALSAAGTTNARSTTLPAIAGSGGYTTSGGNISAWQSGVGAGLATGDLGTGGSIATSSDPTAPAASQDVTIAYGQITAPGTLNNGDTVQIHSQFTDKAGGDPSLPSYTSFKVGQAPSIGSIAPSGAVTNGQPTASFTYTAGAGGGNEYSWQIQIKQGSNVIFDTGTRYDNANSAQLTLAPLLVASTTYSVVVNISSSDKPYPGSSVTATSSPTFATSAFAAQAAPTSPSATPSGPNANIALSWSAASGASYYRVYYRRTAVGGTWYLLADSVVGTGYTAMDNIALGVGYDFAISAVNATPIESAQTSPFSATIPLGSFSAYLHVASQGTAYGLPLQVQGSPTVTKHRVLAQQLGFGQSAPFARYSSGDHHTLQTNALLLDSSPTTLAALSRVVDQVEAGGLCFWRDALGGMLLCTFDPDQGVTIRPPFYREVQLKLTETPNTIGPYLTAGSAQGYLTVVSGTKPPLAVEERLI